jgi:hypothetical protein
MKRSPKILNPFPAAAVALCIGALIVLPFPGYRYVEADGSTGSASCDCSLDNCASWAAGGAPTGLPFEEYSTTAGDNLPCNGANKVYPKSKFIYEKAPYCQNAGSGGPKSQIWERTVTAAGNGGTGDKTVTFKPKFKVSFQSFDDSNVCLARPGRSTSTPISTPR